MPNSFTLSTISGLVIAGAGLGLYLGKSAVSEINPAYFGTPVSASKFHADLAANPPSLDGSALPYETASSAIGLESGCVGCRTYPEEYIPVHDPAVDSYSSYTTYRTEPAERIMADAERYVAQGPSREELDRVQRYAHYRVSGDEVVQVVAETVPEAPAEVEAEEEAAPAS